MRGWTRQHRTRVGMIRPLQITAFELGQRFAGIEERPGPKDNHPAIVWGLELCGLGRNQPDEVAWCSAWANLVAYLLDLPRSKNAAARSWLRVGLPIRLGDAEAGFDVVVLKRGQGHQPGPEVTHGAPGHVGFFAGIEGDHVLILGGNQGDSVSLGRFNVADVLGVRRLA